MGGNFHKTLANLLGDIFCFSLAKKYLIFIMNFGVNCFVLKLEYHDHNKKKRDFVWTRTFNIYSKHVTVDDIGNNKIHISSKKFCHDMVEKFLSWCKTTITHSSKKFVLYKKKSWEGKINKTKQTRFNCRFVYMKSKTTLAWV